MESTLQGVGSSLKATFDTFDTFPKKMKREIVTCRLPGRPGTSDELNAQVAEHNANIAEFIRRCDQCEADLRAAVEKACGTDEMGEVLAAVEDGRTDTPMRAQEAVRLWSRKIEIADAVVAELKVIPAELDKKVEATVAEVKKALEKIGSGLAAQPASLSGHPHIAARQLDVLARNVNVKSRAAIAAAAAARAEHQGAQQTAGSARHGLEAARKTLLNIAKKAIAG